MLVIDKCGCEIVDMLQVDHFDNHQQVGCMDSGSNGFSPWIDRIAQDNYVFGGNKMLLFLYIIN